MSKITKTLSRWFGSKTSTYRKPVLKVENLESREVPATFNWVYAGVGPGDFSTAANWQGGAIPDAGSDIFIGVNTGEMNIDTARSIGKLIIDPATTTWSPTVDVSRTLTVSDGITAKQAVFNIPDTLNITGGVTRTDGSVFRARADYGENGGIDLGYSASWNLFNTTEYLNYIKFNNWGTINAYDSGNFKQTNYYSTNFNNFGFIVADKSTENSTTTTIDIFGVFTNMGTLQVNSQAAVAYGKLSIDANTIKSVVGTFNVGQGGTLDFRNTRNNNVVDLQEDTWNMGPGSWIISSPSKGIQTYGEVFNFNTSTDTTSVSFYVNANWKDSISTINVNGPKAAEASVGVGSSNVYNYTFVGTVFNATLDETANQCTKFNTNGTFTFDSTGNATLNLTILNPINPINGFWFSPVVVGNVGISNDFTYYNIGNLDSKFFALDNVDHAQLKLGWIVKDIVGIINPLNPIEIVVDSTIDPTTVPATSVISFDFTPYMVTVTFDVSLLPVEYNSSQFYVVPGTSLVMLTFTEMPLPTMFDPSVITLDFSSTIVVLTIDNWTATTPVNPIYIDPIVI